MTCSTNRLARLVYCMGDGLSSPWGGVVARYQRHILAAKKHAQNTSIAVLKNTMQHEAYMTPIQYIREKGSTSSDFPSRIGSTTCTRKSMKCLTTSIHGGGGFRLGLL